MRTSVSSIFSPMQAKTQNHLPLGDRKEIRNLGKFALISKIMTFDLSVFKIAEFCFSQLSNSARALI